MINKLLAAVAVTAAATLAHVGDAHAQAGLLGHRTDLEPITLASGKPLAAKPYELESGKYYRIAIEADGSAELAIAGPEFFRNVWVNEVVINDIEVRPLPMPVREDSVYCVPMHGAIVLQSIFRSR